MSLTAEDIRDMNWAAIMVRVSGHRRKVYYALLAAGPSTTRQLGAKMEIEATSVRPRITELVQLGLVRLDQHLTKQRKEKHGTHEGVYYAIPLEEAEALHRRNQDAQLKLL